MLWSIVVFANIAVVVGCCVFFFSMFDIVVYRKQTSAFMKKYTSNVSVYGQENNQKKYEKKDAMSIDFRKAHPFSAFKTEPSVLGISDKVKFSINSRGYRSPEVNEDKESGVIRIAIIGGSVAFQGDTNETSIISMVAQHIRNAGFAVEYINTGTLSYNTEQEISVLVHELLRLHVDLVVALDGFNDIHNFLHATKRLGWPARDKDIKSQGAFEYYPELSPSNELTSVEDVLAATRYYIDNIQIMARICKEFGIKFIACLQPWRDYSPEYCFRSGGVNQAEFLKGKFYCEARRIFSDMNKNNFAKGVYIFMADIFHDKKYLYTDEVHFTDEGNGIVAEKIFEFIKNDF
ncbi:hypothetical protein [Solidesulfovibrio sp. C21]|uniref:hypothetical protein n=1 Tax=Solidesulfovibrio sp. C21 TaxID=3398613 RepID=UPI0039FD4879